MDKGKNLWKWMNNELDDSFKRLSPYIVLDAGCTFNGMSNIEINLANWHFHDANGHNLFANMPNLKKF